MRKFFLLIAVCLLAGCNNMSPKFDPKVQEQIQNQKGQIDEIEHIQNGIKNEMLNLKDNSKIQDSKLDKVQSGLANLQNSNSYQGVQIFTGSGGLLVGLFGMVIFAIFMLHYRRQAVVNGKTADMLAENIAKHHDPDLRENVFKAAMYSDVEEKVYSLIQKHKLG